MLATSAANVLASFSAITTSGRLMSIARSRSTAATAMTFAATGFRTGCEGAGDDVTAGAASATRGRSTGALVDGVTGDDGHATRATITAGTAVAAANIH